MSDYIKLAERPKWVIQYPQCSACCVDLETDGDGWTCPVCGSTWSMGANDGDEGELFESWSGEVLDGEPLDENAAWKEGAKREREERARIFADIDARIAARRYADSIEHPKVIA